MESLGHCDTELNPAGHVGYNGSPTGQGGRCAPLESFHDEAILRRARRHQTDDGDPLIGRCLDGRFHLVERIGEGVHGRVYRAEQLALSRPVAVKVIGPIERLDTSEGAALARALHDEAYAASRLHHPNIVAIHDYGQTPDGLLYLAMEYVEGETLTQLIERNGPLAPPRAVRIVRQILAALRGAHAAGIVHADLQCDNVLVSAADSADAAAEVTVKVIDFGISRMMRGGALTAAEPDTQVLAGTPQAIAPEVILGHQPTERSDIYAAGVILYQLLTATAPSPRPDLLADEHVNTPLDPPSRRAAGSALPAALDRVVMTSMAVDPAERYADVASFLDALARFADGAAPAESPRGESGAARAGSSAQDRRALAACRARAEVAFRRGATGRAIELLRETIGMAIRVGDAVYALECYIALADALNRLRVHIGALAELDEAASLLDTGDTAPRDIWRVYLMRAQLCARLGRHHDAEVAAEKALEHARRVYAVQGCEETVLLLVHLRARHARVTH